MGITKSEEQKEKRLKKSEESPWLLGSINQSNIHIVGVQEGEERETGAERIFEQIMAKNFPNLTKYMNISI